MTITNSSTRLAVIAASVAVAAGLIGAVAIAPAQAAALSSTQVQAIVNLLQSFGADSATIANVTAALNGQATSGTGSTGGSTGGACPALSRDLQQGSTGSDVMALQAFLNASADTRVSASGAGAPGMETTSFGPATKAAVIKFQVKYAITPAAGYVGPMTRAKIASVCGGTGTGTGTGTGSTGSLQGGEGEIIVNGTAGDVETSLDEGEEDVKVLGAELEADDSDIMIERVDVDISTAAATGGQSSQLDDYITEVSLWLGSTRLATMDADEGDEDDDVYSFRFTGLKGVIEEGEEENLYVAVTAVDSIDSDDTTTLDIDIPENGIRAVDAAGISETYVDSNDNIDGGFSVGAAAEGDVEITEGDNNPEGQVVTIDEEDDTNNVLVLEFDLEVEEQDVTIDAIPVGLVSQGEDAGIDGPVKRAILKMDGTVIDTKTIGATTAATTSVLFDDLDLDIDEGETVTFQVLVDLNDADPTTFATGTTLYATTTGSHATWDVEDANGEDVDVGGSVSNSGDVLVFQTEGIEVELVSVSEEKSFVGDTTGQRQIGEFQIVVDVTANGEDMYIDKTATRTGTTAAATGVGTAGNGFMWATTTESTTGSTTIAATVVASGSTSGDTTDAFKINDGSTRRFTLTVSLEAGIDGVAAVQLFGINWDTDGTTDSTADNFFTSNMSDFKTDLLTLLVI